MRCPRDAAPLRNLVTPFTRKTDSGTTGAVLRTAPYRIYVCFHLKLNGFYIFFKLSFHRSGKMSLVISHCVLLFNPLCSCWDSAPNTLSKCNELACGDHLHSQWITINVQCRRNSVCFWRFMSWPCWLLLKDPGFCCPTGPSCRPSILIHLPCRLILISNHFVLTTDGANGFRRVRQRHDFQDVHYVARHDRASSATREWLRAPAAAAGTCGAVVAVAGMILLSLASFSLVLRVHASPVFVRCPKFICLERTRRKNKKNVKVMRFH